MRLYNKFYLLFAVLSAGDHIKQSVMTASYSAGLQVQIPLPFLVFKDTTTSQKVYIITGGAAINTAIASVFHLLVPQTLLFGLLAGFTVAFINFAIQGLFRGKNLSFKPFAFEAKLSEILINSIVSGACALIAFSIALLPIKAFVAVSACALVLFLILVTYQNPESNFAGALSVTVLKIILTIPLMLTFNPVLFVLSSLLTQALILWLINSQA